MWQHIFLFSQHNWWHSFFCFFFHLNVLDLNQSVSQAVGMCESLSTFYRGSFGKSTQQSTSASLRETHSSRLTLRPEPPSRRHLRPAGSYRCSPPGLLINTFCGHRPTLQLCLPYPSSSGGGRCTQMLFFFIASGYNSEVLPLKINSINVLEYYQQNTLERSKTKLLSLQNDLYIL